MRFAELAVFLAPVAAFVLWRVALARGLDGPPPWVLGAICAGLIGLGGWLVWADQTDGMGPGRYVPAHVDGGRLVQGHTE